MTLNVLIGNGSWYPVTASSGPTLVTAPSISAFFSSSAIAGEVLTATAATWQDQDGIVLTGTVGASDLISHSGVPAVFYIGSNPNASSTNNEYQYWYLFVDGVTPYEASINPAYCGITSYDGATKRVTVEWATGQNPTVGGTWYLIKNYPVLRKGQWKRNGVAIANQESRAYTITASDIGQSITYEETAGFVDWTWTQNQLSLSSPPSPTTSTVSVSAPYISSASFNSTNRINSSADFSYLGSFRCTSGSPNSKLSVVPASQSFNGQVSLMLTEGSAREFSIPSLSTNADPSLLNSSTVTRSSASNIYDGWSLESKSGIVNGTITGGVGSISGTSNIFASAAPWYSNQENAIFIKRSADITLTPTLTPFFIFSSQAGLNNKWASGSIVEIPSALQASLGGDYMVASGLTAVAGSNSEAPAGRVFSSADVDAAIASYVSGVTASNGSSSTAVLAVGSSGTTDFYKNWQVVFTVGSTVRIANISAYNASTRTVTFNDIGVSVVSGSSYSLIAPVASKQVYGQDTPYEPDSKKFPALWNTLGGSFNFSAFVPRGTTSIVNITNSWSGRSNYGLWSTYPGITGKAWGGITNDSKRLYANGIYADTSPGPRQGSVWDSGSPYNSCLFWVYDSSDLADVVSGAKTYDQINPRAVFTMPLPYNGLSNPYSAAFDNLNNRLYVYQNIWVRSKNTSYDLVHVYSCNKYV